MRSYLKHIIVLCLILSAINLNAQNTKSAVAAGISLNDRLPLDPAIVHGKLPNGITYFIKQNKKPEKRAELRLAVNAGSILEKDNQQGLAHFTEHMAFNGTKNFARQEIVDFLESIGMRFGPELNAYTSFDETVYMLQLPTDSSDVLEKGFDILEDWAHQITFEGPEIDKERGVIIEEWRLGRGADARMRDKQFPVLFKDSRYAERLPIGKKEVLEGFKHETLKQFYKDWYRPNLMSVIAVGDFDVKKIEDIIKKHFSAIPALKNAPERKYYPVPDHKETLYSIVTDKEAQGSSVAVYYKKKAEDETTVKDYRKTIVEGLYNRMFNDRLYELSKLADPPFIQAGSGKFSLIRTKDAYGLSAWVKENDIPKGLATLLREAERVRLYGFTQTELDRQKKKALRQVEQTYRERDKIESANFAGELVSHYLTGEPAPGIEYENELYKKYVPEITLNEINRLAADLLTPVNRVVLAETPEKEGVTIPTQKDLEAVFTSVSREKITAYEDKFADSDLLTALPVPGKIVSEEKNERLGYTELKLSNGINVILKQTDFKNDEIVFRAVSPGGNSLVPDSSYIPAMTATAVVSEGGVGKFSQVDLQKLLAGKVVRVNPWISELNEGLNGQASPEDMETMFQLIYSYFTAPREDSAAFLSYKSRVKAYLENRSASPESALQDTFQVTMANYHFRSKPLDSQALNKMDIEESMQFYKERFADAGDFTFIFVGNFDPEKMKQMATQYLASLPSKGRDENWKDIGMRYPTGVIEKSVAKGIEPQSKVVIGFSGPFEWTRKNLLDGEAMTGVLNIKLREVLREDKGGTYGVGAWFSPAKYPDSDYTVTISFGCAPERVNEMVSAVFAQIDSLKNQGPAELYVNKQKEIFLRKRETDLKTNGFWVNVFASAITLNEDPAYILNFNNMVHDLTAADIQQAAKRLFNEKNYVRVVLYPENYRQ